VEKKGCEYLIRAMEPIQKAMPEVELVIIGDGPLRGVSRTTGKIPVEAIHFHRRPTGGARSRLDDQSHGVMHTKRRCDIGGRGGFGIVFIEAQSSGLPVVSFSSGGTPEAVRHGESGYLAAERDWRALSEYISKLLGIPICGRALAARDERW